MKIILCCSQGLYRDEAHAAFGATELVSCSDWRAALKAAHPPFLCLIHETDILPWSAFSSALVGRHGDHTGWAAIRYSISDPRVLPLEVPHGNVAVLHSDFSKFLTFVGQRGPVPFLAALAGGRTDFGLLCRRVPRLDDEERKRRLRTLDSWLECAEDGKPITDLLAAEAPLALAWVVGLLEPGAPVPAVDVDAVRTWYIRLLGHPRLHHLECAKTEPSAPPVQVLRAQVSHTWLDHEILFVSADEAVRRWQDGDWGRLQRDFRGYRQRAQALLERLEEFSGYLDYDGPQAEAELGPEVRARFRERALERWRVQADYPALRAAYVAQLEALTMALDGFESTVADLAARASNIASAWQAVRAAAAQFKELFTSGRVPREVSARWT